MRRPEYPRPQFARDRWLNLDGTWRFRFGDGTAEGSVFDRTIEVPFVYQCDLSGIGCDLVHNIVWYQRTFAVPGDWQGQRVMLHFGAVDYRAWIYVNERFVGCHEGGQVGFTFDITDQLTWVDETISVRVEDPSTDELIARGKQTWESRPREVWYTRSTGIWQPVWLEPVPENRIGAVKFTPDVDGGMVAVDFELVGDVTDLDLQIDVSFESQRVAHDTVHNPGRSGTRCLDVFEQRVMNSSFHGGGRCWTPETPSLFDVTMTLSRPDEVVADTVRSYFGMRKISTADGIIYLNNKPYYLKLVLDQGYWPDGLQTAPSDEALRRDIELAKRMGFNGCRKHQKVEDPRFLYWADRLGYLVWGECAAAPSFGDRAVAMAVREWPEIIARDYNHPCIVAWVPLNESWGVTGIVDDVRQQNYSLALYHLIHALDPTRPVISNDGWEHTRSDLCTIHFYRHGVSDDSARFATFVRHIGTRERILEPVPYARNAYARGFEYGGEPIVLSEFGGIGFDVDQADGWGYSRADNAADFVARYRSLIEAVGSSSALAGFCYTQLTDVEQETNGLLTCSRRPKCDLEQIRAGNDLIDKNM